MQANYSNYTETHWISNQTDSTF